MYVTEASHSYLRLMRLTWWDARKNANISRFDGAARRMAVMKCAEIAVNPYLRECARRTIFSQGECKNYTKEVFNYIITVYQLKRILLNYPPKKSFEKDF